MNIDRCYCFQVPFARLKETADAHDLDTVAGLQEHVTFGTNCGLCRPYVRRMLRTGTVTFDRVITEDDEPPPAQDDDSEQAMHDA